MPSRLRRTRPSRMIRAATSAAVSMPIAKQMPCAAPIIAVLMPTTRPLPSTSGPPELPGLSGASVWMTLSISRPDIQDRRVLPGVTGALVRDLADIDRVRQQRIERPAREALPAGMAAVFVDALLRADPCFVELLLQPPHRAQLPVAKKDPPHRLGLLGHDNELSVLGRVAERAEPAHPQALLLRSGDLVAHPFADHLALELVEG